LGYQQTQNLRGRSENEADSVAGRQSRKIKKERRTENNTQIILQKEREKNNNSGSRGRCLPLHRKKSLKYSYKSKQKSKLKTSRYIYDPLLYSTFKVFLNFSETNCVTSVFKGIFQ